MAVSPLRFSIGLALAIFLAGGPGAAPAGAQGAVLNVVPAGSGTVSYVPGTPGVCRLANPPLTPLAEDCTPRFSPGTTVTVTAVPDAGARFVGWSDYGCSSRSTSCRIRVTGERSITATFDPVYLTIQPGTFGDTTVSPPGVVCPFESVLPCQYRLRPGTLVTLTRSRPSDDPARAAWIGSCEGTGPTCALRVDKNDWVGAGASPDETPGQIRQSLTVVRAGTKRGRITGGSLRGGGRTFSCGSICTRSGFAFSESVRLRAIPARRARFLRWSDGSRTASRLVSAGRITRVAAVFGRRR